MPPRSVSVVDRAPDQIDLFPEPLIVDAVDPKRVGGEKTRVVGVYLVKRGANGRTHRVFHDRYGWYCEEHGSGCPLVGELRSAIATGRTAAKIRESRSDGKSPIKRDRAIR